MNLNIEPNFKKGVEFLRKQQKKDGSFTSQSSPNPFDFSKAVEYKTVFSNALILHCLNDISDPRLDLIKRELASFLLKQKSPKLWTFNYWPKGAVQRKERPYPDDLDDTSCALAALYNYDSKLITSKWMAKVIKVLLACEQGPGGPYKTWVVGKKSPDHWQDIDLVVNSNIFYFLSLQGVKMPNLTLFIQKNIDDLNFRSPYYPSEYPVLYFVTRAIKNSKDKFSQKTKDKIIDHLLKKQDKNGFWKDNTQTIFACHSLINIGFGVDKLDKTIKKISACQMPDGSWPAGAICLDPSIKDKPYFSGSPAISTILALELLSKYQNLSQGRVESEVLAKPPTAGEDQKVLNKQLDLVVKEAQAQISKLSIGLKKSGEKFLNEMIRKDKQGEIALISYLFKTSLIKKEAQVKISQEMVTKLGAANLFGWAAYTTYDDIMDEQVGYKLLPLANSFMRLKVLIFADLFPSKSPFRKFYDEVMNKLEEANNWEMSHCRFNKLSNKIRPPDFKNFQILADRAFGHALGAAAILFQLGYKENSVPFKHTKRFFTHYIIARQLNDDCHDWLEDLEKGQICSVGSEVLKEAKSFTNRRHLQRVFWYKVYPNIAKIMLAQVKLAKSNLYLVKIIEPQLLTQFLVLIETSVRDTLIKRKQTLKFLQEYSI